MMFFDLESTTSPANGLYNVARSGSISKKKVITSPASPHHCPSSGFVNQKSSSVARSEIHYGNNFRIVSQAALKGSDGRKFDTSALRHSCTVEWSVVR